MAIKKMPIGKFVSELEAALNRKDGYIMGSKGQNPKKWAANSWWYTQYSGDQKKKALYWREHAERVWDCNGMAEGIYEDFSNREDVASLSLFASTFSEDKLTSLDEYISRAKPEQKNIYYITGDDVPTLRNNPQLESFKENGRIFY